MHNPQVNRSQFILSDAGHSANPLSNRRVILPPEYAAIGRSQSGHCPRSLEHFSRRNLVAVPAVVENIPIALAFVSAKFERWWEAKSYLMKMRRRQTVEPSDKYLGFRNWEPEASR